MRFLYSPQTQKPPNMAEDSSTAARPTAAVPATIRRYRSCSFLSRQHVMAARMPNATANQMGKSLLAIANPRKPPAVSHFSRFMKTSDMPSANSQSHRKKLPAR